jgi:hypothetical protein
MQKNIRLQFYNANLVFLVTDDLKEAEILTGEELDDDFEGIAGFENISNYYIVLMKKYVTPELIVHECFHLADFIVNNYEGIITMKGNAEIRARICELAFKNIRKMTKDLIIW